MRWKECIDVEISGRTGEAEVGEVEVKEMGVEEERVLERDQQKGGEDTH